MSKKMFHRSNPHWINRWLKRLQSFFSTAFNFLKKRFLTTEPQTASATSLVNITKELRSENVRDDPAANLALLNSPAAVTSGQLFLLEIKAVFDLRINFIPWNKGTGKSKLHLFKRMRVRDSGHLKNHIGVIFRQPEIHPSPHAQDFLLTSSESVEHREY